ncbi:hypothetical protein M011DRAFT_530292 [Sporormia fimetaria CBS 119925]|uniref:Uncharacterized protein n=1 Tax=Sporormia fimetaria CBS 119925 TaxID=1340428 RepID=A0A6A6UWM9_9PLEO|nr:hypothetical protein M011DRAFT_530292 [Sporormia fimetaria CBS 119925]
MGLLPKKKNEKGLVKVRTKSGDWVGRPPKQSDYREGSGKRFTCLPKRSGPSSGHGHREDPRGYVSSSARYQAPQAPSGYDNRPEHPGPYNADSTSGGNSRAYGRHPHPNAGNAPYAPGYGGPTASHALHPTHNTGYPPYNPNPGGRPMPQYHTPLPAAIVGTGRGDVIEVEVHEGTGKQVHTNLTTGESCVVQTAVPRGYGASHGTQY